jgi:hypothetical protein
MTKVTYEIVKHDGGWAYRVQETYSEPYPTHAAARAAAELAASEQQASGDSVTISYEDKEGKWHKEVSPGNDRPQTDVEG